MIPKRNLEAIAEAIIKSTRYHDPSSALYAARNPGGLKASSPHHQQDAEGNRVFISVLDGMRALFYDLELKLQGKARYLLLPENTIEDLARAYDMPPAAASVLAKFLRHALSDESITTTTALKRFME